jgi:hypothetical protein
VSEHLQLAAEMMRPDASLHAEAVIGRIAIPQCSDLPAVGCLSKIQNNSGLPQGPGPSFDGRLMARRSMRAICDQGDPP